MASPSCDYCTGRPLAPHPFDSVVQSTSADVCGSLSSYSAGCASNISAQDANPNFAEFPGHVHLQCALMPDWRRPNSSFASPLGAAYLRFKETIYHHSTVSIPAYSPVILRFIAHFYINTLRVLVIQLSFIQYLSSSAMSSTQVFSVVLALRALYHNIKSCLPADYRWLLRSRVASLHRLLRHLTILALISALILPQSYPAAPWAKVTPLVSQLDCLNSQTIQKGC